MRNDSFRIDWVDAGREPACPPDPRFPAGTDNDLSAGRVPSCKTDLPYPARRCGHYVVVCGTCGLRAVISTAGRPDDPRSVTLACLKPAVTQ